MSTQSQGNDGSQSGPDPLGPTYLAAVATALRSVSTTFRGSPASFLFEAGVQAMLHTRLFDLLATHPIRWDLAGKGLLRFGTDGEIALNPVQAEFPAGVRFDIALIGAETRPDVKAWGQPVRVGIELKLWQADGVTGGHFDRDRRKLERYCEAAAEEGRCFTGLCVAFCHDREDPRLSDRARDADIVYADQHLELPQHGVRTMIVSSSR
jgi:hypothetical protein